MPELTDAQKVNREVTQKRIAIALETLAQNSEAPIGLGMKGATVGQVPVVKTVDENGVPISYEPGAVGGDGLPIGGTAGSVLEKASAADYDAKWTNTPTLLGNLAAIEPTGFASKEYLYGDFLVWNGQLYRVKIQTISQGDTLMPGTNVEAVAIGDKVTAISNSLSAINQESALKTFFEDGISAYKRGGVISLNIGYNRTITGSSGQWLTLATVPVLFRPTRTIKFIGWNNSANRGENNYALDFQVMPSGVVNVWVWPDLLSFSPHATVTYIV